MRTDKFSLAEYIRDLEFLVNIDRDSKDIEGLREIARFFEDKYRELGFTVKEHKFHEKVGICLEIRNIEDEYIIF